MYQRMFIACLNLSPVGQCEETIIGVSHTEIGATTHLAEVLEAKGYTQAQIGRLLDRAKVDEMSRNRMGCTIKLRGHAQHYFGRKA